MINRLIASFCVLSNLIAIMTLVLFPAAAQTPPAGAAKKWMPPLTADGQPDLQGVWSYATTTPYNSFWWEWGKPNGRTSLIVDPRDGRLPPFIPAVEQKAASPEARRIANARRGAGPIDSWEDLDASDRCIQHAKSGPPLYPLGYNLNVQTFQTAGYVAILTEQIHDARIVPLDGRPHLGARIRQWMGDSRGRWEGQTLVIETTNFNGRADMAGRPVLPLQDVAEAGRQLMLVERFTRMNADTLNYEYTVTDPGTWTRPWTAVIPMTKTTGHIYEYACHEGNQSMVDMLSGSRAQEKQGSR